MNKDLKQIIDSYKSVEIPEIELESKITAKIKMNKISKYTFNIRTALLVCLVLVLTSTVVFALSKIIRNEDGSHTLINETEDKNWTVTAKKVKDRVDPDEYKMMKRVFEELFEVQIEGAEAAVGYLKYSEEYPEIFTYLVANDTYRYDDTMEILKTHKDTPAYMYDVIKKLQDDFGIEKIRYEYSIAPETYEAIKAECMSKSTFGEVYTDAMPVERKFTSLRFYLSSKDMDKFRDTSVTITEVSSIFSTDGYEIDYETVMIDKRAAMLSKNVNGQYYLITEVNGIGISIFSDPRGNTDNMIELAKKLIEVLENY